MAEAWGLVFTASARALSDAFWPGPLTLVLPGGEGKLPDELRGREGGIAVRHTSHRGIARLVAPHRAAAHLDLGQPARAAAGARPGPAGRAVPRPTCDAGELLVLDGGVLGNVPPSTLVDCTDSGAAHGARRRDPARRAAARRPGGSRRELCFAHEHPHSLRLHRQHLPQPDGRGAAAPTLAPRAGSTR